MSKNKSTLSTNSAQLPMIYTALNGSLAFVPQFDGEIRREVHNGIEYFSLKDITSHFSDLSSDGDVLWRRTQRRLKENGFQLDQKVIQLKLLSSDGKRYKTPCADGYTCFHIINSIPSPNAEPIRRWLTSLGYERLQEIADPALGVQRAVERAAESYRQQGKDDKWIAERIDAISDYKRLCDAIDRVCDKPRYGEIVNTEYKALFGHVAKALQDLLNTKSVRDALPRLALSYLHTAEVGLQELLNQSDRLANDEICSIAREICLPLGDHLQTISNRLGVHPITGAPLLQ